MARRAKPDDEQKMAVKMLTMTQDEKRNAQRKLLIEQGKARRKQAVRREKFYGGK